MVKRIEGAWSLTPDEHAVFALLTAAAPGAGVPTGPGTGEFRRRRINAADAHALGAVETFVQVDHATCKRLAKAGLVLIDAAGDAHITVEGGQAIEAARG